MKFSSMSAAQSRSVLAWPIATRLYLVAFFAAMMLCFFSVPAVGSDNPKPPTPKVCCHVQGKCVQSNNCETPLCACPVNLSEDAALVKNDVFEAAAAASTKRKSKPKPLPKNNCCTIQGMCVSSPTCRKLDCVCGSEDVGVLH